jgi:NAD(P)-dependent dehydrogenase (short-subunit alcohol dehydrogenase family)
MELRGQVGLITGGAQGIGQANAVALAQAGINCIAPGVTDTAMSRAASTRAGRLS